MNEKLKEKIQESVPRIIFHRSQVLRMVVVFVYMILGLVLDKQVKDLTEKTLLYD